MRVIIFFTCLLLFSCKQDITSGNALILYYEKELKDGKFHGIYSIVTNSKFASGHCDLLFSNATCLLSCHFADAAVYIEYCDIWNLKK